MASGPGSSVRDKAEWLLRVAVMTKQRPHGAKTSSRSGSRARVRAADPMPNVEDLPTDERGTPRQSGND